MTIIAGAVRPSFALLASDRRVIRAEWVHGVTSPPAETVSAAGASKIFVADDRPLAIASSGWDGAYQIVARVWLSHGPCRPGTPQADRRLEAASAALSAFVNRRAAGRARLRSDYPLGAAVVIAEAYGGSVLGLQVIRAEPQTLPCCRTVPSLISEPASVAGFYIAPDGNSDNYELFGDRELGPGAAAAHLRRTVASGLAEESRRNPAIPPGTDAVDVVIVGAHGAHLVASGVPVAA